MLAYCLRCKKHSYNVYSKRLIKMINKKIKGKCADKKKVLIKKSRCADCLGNIFW